MMGAVLLAEIVARQITESGAGIRRLKAPRTSRISWAVLPTPPRAEKDRPLRPTTSALIALTPAGEAFYPVVLTAHPGPRNRTRFCHYLAKARCPGAMMTGTAS